MRRVLVLLLLILGLAPGTWVYETRKPWDGRLTLEAELLPLPPRGEVAGLLGAFVLERAWSLTSAHSGFGGFSALVPLPEGRLLAIGDNGRYLAFSPPGAVYRPPEGGVVFGKALDDKPSRDVEAATRDPVTGTIWTARESINAIARHDAALRVEGTVRPAAMRGWDDNSGPEAMVRLADGRFVVLAEGFDGILEWRRHEAVLFSGDPLRRPRAVRFAFAGPRWFSPTDMAQLPDGRVLILMRRLVWPLPLRFEGRIVIADPAAIRPGQVWPGTVVATLAPPLPVDNFEGMAIEPRDDGRVTVWLISDHNNAVTQRTLLWKLSVDPVRLPRADELPARKKARG